jgi:hypothetical protein
MSDIRKEIFYSLKRYGISIPFPVRTIYQYEGKPVAEEWKETYRHRLYVQSGHLEKAIFPLAEKTVKIGRGAECEIDLHDPSISKDHAKIDFKDGRYLITDLGSKHGTFVNDIKIEKRKLMSGDEIRIGDSRLRFEEIKLS